MIQVKMTHCSFSHVNNLKHFDHELAKSFYKDSRLSMKYGVLYKHTPLLPLSKRELWPSRSSLLELCGELPVYH